MRRAIPLALLLLVLALPASAAPLPLVATQDWWPVWSPDGQWIAFTRVDGRGRQFALEVVPAGGGRVVQVARAASQLSPSWSPDSTRLAYQAGSRVYKVERDGSGRQSVSAGLFPAWSPDGSTVAYVRAGALHAGSQVLATSVISKPAWSPDGGELAFARSDGIHVVTLAGAERLVAGTAGEPSAPVFSYDGTKLAYTVGGFVYVATADGSGPPAAVAGRYSSVDAPSWAPTGDALVYTADGAVRVTWLSAPPRTVAGARAAVGAAFSPGDLNGYRVAASVPLPRCPGHSGIDSGPLLSGTCTIEGTRGPDVIEGTPLWGDVIRAGAGNDRIHANDGHTDRVDCGPGRDIVWADRRDRLVHCEVVHR